MGLDLAHELAHVEKGCTVTCLRETAPPTKSSTKPSEAFGQEPNTGNFACVHQHKRLIKVLKHLKTLETSISVKPSKHSPVALLDNVSLKRVLFASLALVSLAWLALSLGAWPCWAFPLCSPAS